MTDATPDIEQIEYGPHSVLIDHARRTAEVYSDDSASHGAAQEDWCKVTAKLAELGCSGLDEIGSDRGVTVFRATF